MKVLKWEIAVGTNLYRGCDLETTLKSLKRCNVEYVDLDFLGPLPFQKEVVLAHVTKEDLEEPEKIKETLDESGLRSVTFSGHVDLSDEVNLKFFFKKMEFAKKIGAQFIGAFSGPSTKKKEFLRNVRLVEEKARKIGIVVSLETEMPGDLISRGLDGVEILKEINSPFVRLLYDFGNIYFVNQGNVDLISDLRESVNFLGNLHFKDVLFEGGVLRYCPIGQGIINYVAIVDFLNECSKSFPITIEIPYFLRSKGWKPFEVVEQAKPLEEIERMVRESLNYVYNLLRLN